MTKLSLNEEIARAFEADYTEEMLETEDNYSDWDLLEDSWDYDMFDFEIGEPEEEENQQTMEVRLREELEDEKDLEVCEAILSSPNFKTISFQELMDSL